MSSIADVLEAEQGVDSAQIGTSRIQRDCCQVVPQ